MQNPGSLQPLTISDLTAGLPSALSQIMSCSRSSAPPGSFELQFFWYFVSSYTQSPGDSFRCPHLSISVLLSRDSHLTENMEAVVEVLSHFPGLSLTRVFAAYLSPGHEGPRKPVLLIMLQIQSSPAVERNLSCSRPPLALHSIFKPSLPLALSST